MSTLIHSNRRNLILGAIGLTFVVGLYHVSSLPGSTSAPLGAAPIHQDIIPGTTTDVANPKAEPSSLNSIARPDPSTAHKGTSATATGSKTDPNSPLSPGVLNYFDQIFSLDTPPDYEFAALGEACANTKWQEDEVYLRCGGMSAGLTSIMSQLKVCFKMAIDSGSSIVLPAMPLRDSTNLKEFNFLNGDAYLTYEEWFDAAHLISSIGRVCPQMKIIHPISLDTSTPVKNKWNINIGDAEGYVAFSSFFWRGRPFRDFFNTQYEKLKELQELQPDNDPMKHGINVIGIASPFLVFRVTDDATGFDLKVWNDLSHLIRFRDEPREIVNSLLQKLNRPFYGVHFRAENDTIWSSPDNQLHVDLDMLDTVYAKYGSGNAADKKPLVYLACGDQRQVEAFKAAGALRGWDVTDKWTLAQGDGEILSMINDLAFDFQGAVDYGIMLKSHFFMGITGSAFSSTVGNARDSTGRYRGSSLLGAYDDGNARTHLFNDGEASAYPCCL